MPSTGEIDGLMKGWSAQWSDLPTYPPGAAGSGVFNDLWGRVEAYMAKDPKPHLGLRLNYETVMGEMVALAHWATPSPFGNALNAAVEDPGLSSAFSWPPGKDGPYFHRQMIIQQLGDLVSALASHMRERCQQLDTASSDFRTYATVLESLAGRYDIGVYNLNYDTLAIRALPEAFTGFTGGAFDARAVSDRNEWNFVYHLHGSVHYSLAGQSLYQNVIWKDDLTENFEDSRHLTPSMAAQFRPVIPTTLIAGGFKLDQLLADPAQTLFASLVRHVHQADCFLLAGYGFADTHINRALQNRFAGASQDHRRGRPPTVVVTKTTPPFGRIADREGHEFVAWELTHALATKFSPALAGSKQSFAVEELIARGAFETDARGTRVWHGGFAELEPHLDSLITALQGP